MKPEEYAESIGARHFESKGWGHLDGSFLVHCYRPHCDRPDEEHGLFTHWTIQSPWVKKEAQ